MGTLEVTIMADTTWTPYAVEMTAENAKKALVAGLRVAQTPGILLADGQGGVRTALPGDDYGYPLLQGNGPPSAANVANVGQHYFDLTASGPPYEYICVGYTEAGFVWRVYGDPGAGFYPKGRFLSLDALQEAIEAGLADAPSPGDAYFIGEAAPYDVYFYDGQTLSWVNLGPLGGNGSTAAGIPPHGAAGQFLIKKTAADYDAVWSEIPDNSIDAAMLKADAVTAAKLADDAVETAAIKNSNVTAAKLADECKNIIRESVALAASAFVADSTVDGARYKAELAITGCTAAMLPIIAWTAVQSDALDVKRIQSAAGKIIIYSADAPGADLTIPTVALISPIGTGSSGTANYSGGDSTGTLTSTAIIAALGYTPLQESDIVTETTEILPSYTNQIAAAGYEASAQLNMTGAVESGTSFVSGFIPVKKGDVIRVKDPSASEFSTGLVFALYKADKATGNNIGRYINTMQSNTVYGTVTISGNVLTWDTSTVGYYFWSDFAYVRVTTNSADSILTVNEEIAETAQTVKTLKSGIKVSKSNLNFETSPAMLADRKIVVFGDSLIGLTRDQTSVTAYAAAYTGATVYNVGFGGCRMSTHPTSGYAAFSMWALADAITTNTWTTQDAQASSGADYFPEQLALLKSIDFSTVDEIVIHYGTNDFAANVQIDDSSNTTSTSTVCGALRYSIQKILGAYPKIKIFVSLPIYRMWNSVGAETYTNSLGKKLPEYNVTMQTVAAEFNLPVIDGYGRLGINKFNDATFSSDGTHLTDLGRRAFGELIGGCLIAGG